MSDGPRVSVIMGIHNDEAYVSSAVESILAQNFEDFELIVVDDASTDRTLDRLDAFEDERLRVLKNETNRGLTRSLNRALEHARGELVARQDADDRSRPGRLERQVTFLDDHPEVAVVGTGALLVDDAGGVRGRRRVLSAPSPADFRQRNQLIHGSVMGRTAVLREIGGYDEFYRYAQDYELWLRLVEDHEIRNLDQPLYCFRIHEASVYFASKEASLLYAMFALATSEDRLNKEIRAVVRDTGVETYYDYLEEPERARFHRQLAEISLRYGRPAAAREHSSMAVRAAALEPRGAILYLLSFLGRRPAAAVRSTVRRALNLKIMARNAVWWG